MKGYDGFVEMSEAIMKGRSPEQQRQTVLVVLKSVLPAIIPWAARNFFRPTELTCYLCAFFANAGFAWVRSSFFLHPFYTKTLRGLLLTGQHMCSWLGIWSCKRKR